MTGIVLARGGVGGLIREDEQRSEAGEREVAIYRGNLKEGGGKCRGGNSYDEVGSRS